MKKILVLIFSLLIFASCGSAGENRYVNHEVGFSLAGPEGWFEKPAEGGQLVRYTPGPFEDFPVFSVLLEEALPQEKGSTLLDYSQMIFLDFHKNYKTKTIKPPKAVEIDGIRGARFLLEIENVKRPTNEVVWLRGLFYQFMKGGKIVSLMAMAESEQFERYHKAFEKAMLSFRWVGEE